jgi:hypothetical protein
MKVSLCSFLFVLLAASAAALASSVPSLAKAQEMVRELPLRFEPAADGASYRARGAGFDLRLTQEGAQVSLDGAQLRISLLHAEAVRKLEGVDRLAAKAGYFHGNDRKRWRTDVPQYSRVKYPSVYPGVDLVYYGNGRQLEYDFVVQPGTNPNCIAMNFDGADRLSVDYDGNLVVDVNGKHLVQHAPAIYQKDETGIRLVEGNYTLIGRNLAAFEVGRYDRSKPLVIDPVLSYATYIGGSGTDEVKAVTVDSLGIVSIIGVTNSADLSSTASSYQVAVNGNLDIFVAQIDPTKSGAASLVSLSLLGGDGADVPNAVALDRFGNICITGYTLSTDFPLSGLVTQNQPAGAEDAFALKFNPKLFGTDSLTYSTYVGGTGSDIGYGIAVDAQGILYITGTTKSTDFPVTANAAQQSNIGGVDAFIAVLDQSSASPVYSTYLGGGKTDEGRGILPGPNSTVYVTGWTASPDFPVAGNAYRGSYQGGGDIFFTQLDRNQTGPGAVLYSTYIGGTSGDEEPRRMIADSTGRPVITGFTTSTDFPVTSNAYQPAFGGVADAFVMRLDPGKTPFIQYATYFGGADGDVAYDIAIDANDNVYLAGYTFSSNLAVTQDAAQLVWGMGQNAFVARLNLSAAPRAALTYCTYAGGVAVTTGYGITVGSDGTMYAGGFSQDTNALPITSNALQFGNNSVAGDVDGFLLVVKP